MKLILLTIFSLIFASQALASSWEECHFESRVIKSSKEEIELIVEKHIGGDGMVGDPGEKACRQFLGPLKIATKDFGADSQAMKPGDKIKVSRSHYSGLSPTGPVSSSKWRILVPSQSAPKSK